MNALKKMKAICRLLGGINHLVITQTEQLLIKVGLQQKMDDLYSRVKANEQQNAV